MSIEFERFMVGRIIFQKLMARDVDGATHEILNTVKRINKGTTIYFDAWDALGTIAVLRSIVQVLQSKKDPYPGLCFDKIIYIDCSIWKSNRVMQRKIAEELKLDHKTMAMFHNEDEEDDFNGVDPASRDAITDVAAVIDQTLRDSSFMMIFLNGSDQEVVLSTLGVSAYHGIKIWTFKRRSPTRGIIRSSIFSDMQMLPSKLRYTNIFLFGLSDISEVLNGSEISALLHEEVSTILTHHPCMQENDRAMVLDCYHYGLFLHYTFHETANQYWAAHGANYWICDGIIQEARASEISKALYQEVSFECEKTSIFDLAKIKSEIMQRPDTPYLVFDDADDDHSWINASMPRRWISITTKNKIVGANMMKSMLARASSVILAFDRPHELPNDLMEHCSNLRVLILSYCNFNFSSPLLHHCHTLRFLGLDHCRNNHTRQLPEREDNISKWTCLQVLDLRYTDWDGILSDDSYDVMSNIMELNIEGSMCWQYMGQLEGRLPHLQRMRIVKPQRQACSLMKIDNSFMGKTKLEVLDLSGNKDMEKLPSSLSMATNLQVVVLDGCDALENIALSNTLLRSFSFDGYGPASTWTSMDELPPKTSRPERPPDASNNKDVKISSLTLDGCTQLKNLFLRGLPNLVELDLSGCAIKILDFQTMVVDVPRLKRLFLLGCEHLCAIRWGQIFEGILLGGKMMTVNLELLFIDTRPGDGVLGRTRTSVARHPTKPFALQVYAITANARFTRSLCPPMQHYWRAMRDFFFEIRITSSNIISDEKNDEKYQLVVASLYKDVSTEVGDSFLKPVQAFPQPPTSPFDRHIEIGGGSCNVESEMGVRSDVNNLPLLVSSAQSLHVHDTWTSIVMPYAIRMRHMKWCRVERCPRLEYVFPPQVDPGSLETIWASELLMARCIWSKGRLYTGSKFGDLQHLHLRSCPSLQFALPVWTSSFPKLKTLHIVHCGSLTHVFAVDNKEFNINSSELLFPELTTIQLHDAPALQKISEINTMIAPKLETIKTRGCWNLLRLPALGLEKGERRRPTVEMEKDAWKALEWDGVEAGHHHSLYKAPLHSRYFKSTRLLRGTVLR